MAKKELLPKSELRNLLSEHISEGFVKELERKIPRGGINESIKSTPLVLKELEHLTNLYFSNKYNPKRNISIQNITNSSYTRDKQFIRAESMFLFLTSAYLCLSFDLSKKIEIVFREKIISAINSFNVQFDELIKKHLEEHPFRGLLSLDKERSLQLYFAGLGVYYLRNIIGMSRLSLAKKYGKTSTTKIFQVEKQLDMLDGINSNSQNKDFKFEDLPTLILDPEDWFKLLNIFFITSIEKRNGLDKFIFIISNLKFGTNMIDEAFNGIKDKYQEESDGRYKHVQKLHDPFYEVNNLSLKAHYSLRAIQMYWLENIFKTKTNTYDNFDGVIRMDSKDLIVNSGKEEDPLIFSDTQSKVFWKLNEAHKEPSYSDESSRIPEQLEELMLSNSFFGGKGLIEESLIFYRIESDSMRPDFLLGDILFIQKDTSFEDDSKFYLVLYKEDFKISKIIPSVANQNDKSYILKFTNSDFPDIDVNKNEFKVYGTVISSYKNV